MKKFQESIKLLRKARNQKILQESPMIQVHVPDNLDKKTRNDLIKEIEKQGKTVLYGEIFTEHKNFLQKMIDIICSDEQLISNCHIGATKLGFVLVLNEKTLKPYKTMASEFKDLECIVTMDHNYTLTSFLKLEIGNRVIGSKFKNCKKHLMWRDLSNSVPLTNLIFDIYFLQLKNKALLSDDIYTEEGEKSLDKLVSTSINKGWKVSVVKNNKVMKTLDSDDQYFEEKPIYFGYDQEKRDFRILIEKQ